ncbi:Serine-protein kinase RsbW [Nocardioides dokdonensis FR1436]|uniref:Serine-protein kinase RsbW n=1 Tax=Nocardioides dokdonensis FR1436 TaxID=1300347 RepID=A0A1A9GPU3_9ACTN|nr:anti-sigma factor [Nocardioides dokdonensis]ANH40357.1 Serine-protein kinase RsbW [Nocardioides dokdonensis FR1436]
MTVSAATADAAADRPDVEIRLPADGAFVSVLRITTAGLAARLDFTIEDIEDLRIAVGEACAMVLPEADEGADLVGRFFLRPGELTVSVAVASAQPAAPDYDSFAWQVLTTLATSADVGTSQGQFLVTMVMHSTALGDGR